MTISKEVLDRLWIEATTPAHWFPSSTDPDGSPVCLVEPALLQDMVRLLRTPAPEAAPTISAGGSYDLKLYGTPGYTGTVGPGLTVHCDPAVPEHTIIVRDDLGRELGRIINIGGSSQPQGGRT